MRRRTPFLMGVMLATATATTPVQGAATASGAAPVTATRQETAVEGTVRASEQPQRLAGASIILEGQGNAAGTRREVVSGDDGSFMFESIPAGEYQITAGMLGRRMATRDVTVVAGETARVDFALEIEALSGRTGCHRHRSANLGSGGADAHNDRKPRRYRAARAEERGRTRAHGGARGGVHR